MNGKCIYPNVNFSFAVMLTAENDFLKCSYSMQGVKNLFHVSAISSSLKMSVSSN